MHVAILENSNITRAGEVGREIAAWLTAEGVEPTLFKTHSAELDHQNFEDYAFMVVLGGDGTTLRAARLTAAYDLPIFGVNLGRVGFLSEAEPDNWRERIGRVLKDEHWVETRLMLRAEVIREGQSLGTLIALNDMVVSRGIPLRMATFHLSVDGDPVTVYSADALIAATPTGSTAYSLAAGGPILPPQLKNFLVLPVAPHLSFQQALVLHEKAVIMVRLETGHEAVVTADGQDAIPLQHGDEVVICRYSHDSRFIRLDSPGYFYQRLMEKLNYWSLKTVQ